MHSAHGVACRLGRRVADGLVPGVPAAAMILRTGVRDNRLSVARNRFQLPIAVQLGLLLVMDLRPPGVHWRLPADRDRPDGDPAVSCLGHPDGARPKFAPDLPLAVEAILLRKPCRPALE